MSVEKKQTLISGQTGSAKITGKSTCCYCGVGCGVEIRKDRMGNIHVEGDSAYPVNRGKLCSKGMNLHYTVNDRSDRLLYPEVRYNRYQQRQRTGWEEALTRTAAVFRSLIKKYGPDSVAFYASGQCLTEEYYVLNKMVKGFIGTNNIDTNSRLCMSSAVTAYKMSLGEDIVPVCYDDIEEADTIFIAGGNPAWCHPIIWRRVEAAKEKNPSLRIIVSDPRQTQTAQSADLHLQINPGTDITLHFAITRWLIENNGVDETFVSRYTRGFEDLKTQVYERSIVEAAVICGIAEESIIKAAELIGESRAFLSMWTMGLNQSVVGVNKNLSLINLHLITGQIGKPGAGPLSLTGQPNAMGGREVGGLSNLLPAHRDLQDPAHRAEVERYWNVSPGTISPKPGLTATEMFEALHDGRLKAIWILCTNPLVSLPDSRFAEDALKKAKFVVVQEISNKPETLQYADVVFPAAGWAEKEGTMTNAERRISYLEKMIDPPGEALPDAEIICRFAEKMGFNGFDFRNTESIFREHAQLTAGTHTDISSVGYGLLKQLRSMQWPYNAEKYPKGRARFFTDNHFTTIDGKAVIHAFPDHNGSVQPNADFPLILTTGRIRDQWHTMSKTGKVSKLRAHTGHAYLEIHPTDAEVRKLRENALADILSPQGSVRVRVRISASIKQGVVFIPMHWGKMPGSDLHRVNNLTQRLTDPKSREPDFKFTAVQVVPYKKSAQKIVVIGAGAGAYGFVKSHRAVHTNDEITVFSKEKDPFYNRVLLPEYISGAGTWKDLVRMNEEEEKQFRIILHKGVSVEHINREQKILTDSRGDTHAYDILVLATGSRPMLLPALPEMKGIFTLRSRSDADSFRAHLHPQKGQVIVVGGGLLGIELAASLREMDIGVVIIQRISRLMDRQLDPTGSQLLHEELTDKGIDISYNDEIDKFTGQESVTGIRLKSGQSIPCQAVVIAIGTTPNVELARSADLECRRGAIVDEYLRTSDPSIFAIGEIAEYDGFLYGITAAAEQQAAVVASYLQGDIAHSYKGSLLMNILKIRGISFCSLGMTECPDDPAYEEVLFIDKAKRYYKKCIIHNDRLVGAILIGDKTEFLEFRDLIQNKTELSEKRIQLLRSGQPAERISGKLVCSCANVGEGNIRNKIENGCRDLLQLYQLSGAGMGCGSCRPEVKQILERLTEAEKPDPVVV